MQMNKGFCLYTGLLVGSLVFSSVVNAETDVNSRTARLEKQVKVLKAEIRKLAKIDRAIVKHIRKGKYADKSIIKKIKKLEKLQKQTNPVYADAPLLMRKKLSSTASVLDFMKALKSFDLKNTDRNLANRYPLIEIGGSLGGSFNNKTSYLGAKTNDLSITGANLVVSSEINPWFSGLMSFAFDGGPVNSTVTQPSSASVVRIANSRIFLSRAFLSFGDLSQYPVYGALGQMFMPFGEFSTQLSAPSVTSRLGRILQRGVLVGYQQPCGSPGFNAAVFAFKGDSRKIGTTQVVNNFGIDTGYGLEVGDVKLSFGGSYIHNIADAAGMQDTKAPFKLFDDNSDFSDLIDDEEDFPSNTFAGFGTSDNSEKLHKLVPAVDLRGKVKYKAFSLSGEYVGSLTHFDRQDLSYNLNGARPRAFNAEAAYEFELLKTPTTLAGGLSRSYEALALSAPEMSYGVALKSKVMKNISTTLGCQHDVNYPVSDSASGMTNPISGLSNLGHASTVYSFGVTADF